MKQTSLLLPLLLVLACSSLYTGVVTLTSVVDSAMKNWASLSVSGKTTPAIDLAVKAAHDKYRAAAATAQVALVSYKNGGAQTDWQNALTAVRAAASSLIDLVVPLVTPAQATTLKSNLSKAGAL